MRSRSDDERSARRGGAKPPHPATVVQPKLPHAATVFQPKALPPHPATLVPTSAHPAQAQRKAGPAPRPACRGVLQRAMLAFTIHDIGFTQSSISPRFTDGTHLNGVIADLTRGRLLPGAFPPLKIFTITDPWDDSVHTYSLSNRRLYVFRKANVGAFPHAATPLDEVVACTWQFTNATEDFPAVDVNPRKDVDLYSDALLIRFRRDVENWTSALEANWNPENDGTWQDRLREYVMNRYDFRHTPP